MGCLRISYGKHRRKDAVASLAHTGQFVGVKAACREIYQKFRVQCVVSGLVLRCLSTAVDQVAKIGRKRGSLVLRAGSEMQRPSLFQ